jgi:hypothetical protein
MIEVPYCVCYNCVCKTCKKPFAYWVKDISESFRQTKRFNGKCKECYDNKIENNLIKKITL